MGKFGVGSRVQAVDELGRWCDGRVADLKTEGVLVVRFPGYRGHEISTQDQQMIRTPVPPLQEQERRTNTYASSRREARATRPTKEQLRFLAKCQRGDIVCTADGDDVIDIVDPFKQTLLTQSGLSLNIHSIVLPETQTDVLPLKRSRKKKVPIQCKINTGQGETREANASCIPAEVNQTQEPQIEQTDNRVFRLGHHQCGKVYEVHGLTIIVIIVQINLLDHSALCWPVVGDEVNEDISVSLKLSSLKDSDHPVPAKSKKVATRLVREMFQASRHNMKSPTFREGFRKMQLSEGLVKEISLTFWSSSRRRSFDLGFLSMEHDFDLLGLAIPDCTSAEFSYFKGSIGKLDALLGSLWDITMRDGVTRYVTVVRIRITSDLRINGCVRVADFDRVLPAITFSGNNAVQYRTILQDHMKSLY